MPPAKHDLDLRSISWHYKVSEIVKLLIVRILKECSHLRTVAKGVEGIRDMLSTEGTSCKTIYSMVSKSAR
jgi:hypothetical protein